MKKKISFYAFMALCIVVAFCMIVAISVMFPVALIAYADDEVQEPEEVTEVEEQAKEQPQVVIVEKEVEKDDDDLKTVFKNNILPYIVSAGEMSLALLVMIIPYIKLRGKNSTLQGALSVASKTIDHYKKYAENLTKESIVEAINKTIVPELKAFLLSEIKSAIAENVKDTTGDINKIESKVDLLSMQTGNFLKAATLAWCDVDGAKELLMKSPTAQKVVELLGEMKDLKAKVEAQNGAQIEPINEVIKQLEGYGNENE